METDSLHVNQFTDMLQLYDLKQNIIDPTHDQGHTLDVVITPNKQHYIQNIHITETDVSILHMM